MRTRTGLPSTSIRSPKEMRWPVCAGSPLTLIRPSTIRSSMSRREPMPAWASTLCSFGASGSAASTRLLAASSVSTGASASVSNSPASTLAKTSPASGGATGCRCSGSGPSKFGGSGSARRGRLPSPPAARRLRRGAGRVGRDAGCARRVRRRPRSPSPRSPRRPRCASPSARRRRLGARRGVAARAALGAGVRRCRRVAAFEIALRQGVVRSVHGWVPERGRRAWRGNRVGIRMPDRHRPSASPAASANDSEDCAASAASAS